MEAVFASITIFWFNPDQKLYIGDNLISKTPSDQYLFIKELASHDFFDIVFEMIFYDHTYRLELWISDPTTMSIVNDWFYYAIEDAISGDCSFMCKLSNKDKQMREYVQDKLYTYFTKYVQGVFNCNGDVIRLQKFLDNYLCTIRIMMDKYPLQLILSQTCPPYRPLACTYPDFQPLCTYP